MDFENLIIFKIISPNSSQIHIQYSEPLSFLNNPINSSWINKLSLFYSWNKVTKEVHSIKEDSIKSFQNKCKNKFHQELKRDEIVKTEFSSIF